MKTGEVLDGRYELVRCIGGGGMGSVWEATQLSSGRRVAIKALHEHLIAETDLVARFLRESRAALESRYSGHIIEVIDVVSPPGRAPYQVMEFLEGEDLSQILKREGPLEPERAVELIVQACHAVAEVHRQGIIHRDIKPDNLFVVRLSNGAEWIKLLDFGVAKFRIPPDSDERQLTAVGSAVGTPHYMAPEQILSVQTLDHRADVYSMGVVLYELLTGQRPYRTGNIAELVTVIAQGQPPMPRELRPELSRELERVVLRAMALDKENRFESMFELAEVLEPLLHDEDSRSEPIYDVKTIRTKVEKTRVPDLNEPTFDMEDFGRTYRQVMFPEGEEASSTSPDRQRSTIPNLYPKADEDDETRVARPKAELAIGEAATNPAIPQLLVPDEREEELGAHPNDSGTEPSARPNDSGTPPFPFGPAVRQDQGPGALPQLYESSEGGDEEETLLSPPLALPPASPEPPAELAAEGGNPHVSADSAPPSLYSLYDDVDDDDETIAMIMPEPHDEEEQGSLFGSSQSRFALYVILALCFMAILLSALVGFIVLSASQ